ncbi:hypothetical protein [Sorangium sp. So ce131]|uniref:hypothetical protein n=1 Tax=Sorangium sp. So ce131 TaxID=3133282 RepID=UPI003F6293A2
MLVIRKEQVAVFRAESQRRFAARMRAYIAEEHPDRYRTLGDDGTAVLVEKGIEKAARHGIDAEGPTAVLIELMLEFGERLERSPDRAWAEKILASPELPGEVKVAAVRDRFAARAGGRPLVMASTSPKRS